MTTDRLGTSGSSSSRPSRAATSSLHPSDAPRFRPRACAKCSSSKLRCNWLSEPGEAPCERCARMKTECLLPSLKPRGPRRGNPTRVGQLEQKLDGIMSLLTASQHVQPTAPAALSASTATLTATDTPPNAHDSPASVSTRGGSTSAPSPDSSRSHASQAHAHSQLPHRHAGSGTATPVTSTTSSPGSSLPPPPRVQQPHQDQPPPLYPPPQGDLLPSLANVLGTQNPLTHPPTHVEVLPGLKVTFRDADLALDEYRRTYSPHFPFVPLAANLTAFELYQAEPLLFKIILQVVLPQPPQMQRDAKRWFREQIALHVVTNEEKSVSLLQAILLYVAWSDLGFYVDPRVTPLLQLAAGLVSDLGLCRPMHHDRSVTLNAFIADATTALCGFGHVRPPHTLEGIRAMLGCYYVCALSGSFFRRIHPLPFTAYMDDCCDRLLAANEHASDALAVALARMQRVAARVYAVLPSPDVDAPPALAFAPVYMAMATLRKELDQLVHGMPRDDGRGGGGDGDAGDARDGGLPAHVRSNCFLWTHYHATLVRLYEPAIFLRLRTASSSAIDLADTGLRTEALWNCLQATRDFFDAYTAIPPDVLGVLPLLGTVHLSFGIVTLTRLLSLDAPEWHIGQARLSLDFVALALRLERLFQAADEFEATPPGTAAPPSIPRKRRYAYYDSRTILATHRDKMRWIRIWYTTKMPPDPHQVPPPWTAASHRAAPHKMPWSAESAAAVASAPPAAVASPLPYPFSGPENQGQVPQTMQSAQSQATTNVMDVDTDNAAASHGSRNSNSNTPNERLVVSPGAMNIPLEEFDSNFWKAIFDLDNTWEPMAQ
ncbi:fungal transcriptional regulatory protein [Sporothrix brasiliensis 5110]|uniref:Fungal transcriptional regulatory protein n=1 Tax=Sporothrix brasiliensis 5110 TaxID=1398154 RepID=A0A0C2IL37_9PEZI|nr:fungal transcriptional regulatory protein [Sporothrix brasiliensis 5110]KIH89816.1 fungal transcriptional regulatory protein [Sporothrix brasiliensis 5110]